MTADFEHKPFIVLKNEDMAQLTMTKKWTS